MSRRWFSKFGQRRNSKLTVHTNRFALDNLDSFNKFLKNVRPLHHNKTQTNGTFPLN